MAGHGFPANYGTTDLARALAILIFLLLPILEIAGFVLVGSKIGVLSTIALVVASGIAGAALLRWQGMGAVRRVRREMEASGNPGRELAHGAMIFLAGVLLLMPGFITDIAGLLLFIPPVRDLVWRLLRDRLPATTSYTVYTGRGFRRRDSSTIDLDEDDYSVERPPERPAERPHQRIDRG